LNRKSRLANKGLEYPISASYEILLVNVVTVFTLALN